jgi:predicted nucleotide-binding protein
MQNGIERLNRRIAELEALDLHAIQTRRSPQVVALETAIEDTLAGVFGHGRRFNRYRPAADLEPPAVLSLTPSWIAARGGGHEGDENIHELRTQIDERKQRSLVLLQQAAQSLQEEVEQLPSGAAAQATTVPPPTAHVAPSNKIFVVHGRDDAAKNELALFLRAIGLEPIILHLRPNGGRHLLTKFTEEAEGAGFAVVLMTPDDEGGLAGDNDRKPRARQNVVFELGFFIGRLGPAHVAALLKGDVEKPSDFDGIAYISFDAGGRWKTDLARELHHAKVPFDPAKAFSA